MVPKVTKDKDKDYTCKDKDNYLNLVLKESLRTRTRISITAETSGKPLDELGFATNPAGGTHSAPPDPLSGAEWLLPLPKNPTPPLLGFGSSVVAPSR